jgi:hypothetical protein
MLDSSASRITLLLGEPKSARIGTNLFLWRGRRERPAKKAPEKYDNQSQWQRGERQACGGKAGGGNNDREQTKQQSYPCGRVGEVRSSRPIWVFSGLSVADRLGIRKSHLRASCWDWPTIYPGGSFVPMAYPKASWLHADFKPVNFFDKLLGVPGDPTEFQKAMRCESVARQNVVNVKVQRRVSLAPGATLEA